MKLQRPFSLRASTICEDTGVRRTLTCQWVAFKMYYRLSPAQTADLEDASELTLYSGGYGGIQPVEDGIANFCCVVKQRYFAQAGLRWGEPHCEDAAGLSSPRDAARRCCATARQTDRNHSYPVWLHTPHNREWALLRRRSGCGNPLVHRRWHIHRPAYCPPCRYCIILPRSRRRSFSQNYAPQCCPRLRLAEFAANGLNNSAPRARGAAILPKSLARRDARDGRRVTRVTQPDAVRSTGVR